MRFFLPVQTGEMVCDLLHRRERRLHAIHGVEILHRPGHVIYQVAGIRVRLGRLQLTG